ncbi:DUF2523 family protein [Pseudoxanthomonas sp.]|uniref:DUF2523 family protein n=1 Tax=Pseudoxanthomonas sp. TaxID=1871049 RepID=UPI00258B8C0C|nr:DUF2523 family protein [Pseudoxanthomonas sp.]MCR6687085.1 DUF2523 domain-containing protein [Pseudoxanthomonas sp.]
MPAWLAALVPTIVAAVGQAFRAFWPQVIRGFGWLAKSRGGLFLTTLFVWLGINLGTVKVIVEPTINQLRQFAQSGGSFGEYGPVAMQWAGMLRLDEAITMVISAVVAKHAIMAGRLFLFKRGYGAAP